MDTKLSIALLSGISLFMSFGAFAVADGLESDDLNWSYVMGDTKPVKMVNDGALEEPTIPMAESAAKNGITCTSGCPARPNEPVEPLTLTYEDEAMPLAERAGTFEPEDRFTPPPSFSVREPAPVQQAAAQPAPAVPVVNPIPQIETRYVTTPAKTEYPITRQYPISVQYPITVQRNMTVEQPVVMQQPIVVRRPVVMQQDITVQRQPTIIHGQPMVMQQQPSFVQQPPVFVQAPAATLDPAMLTQMNNSNVPALPVDMSASFTLPPQSIPMPQQPPLAAPMPTLQQPVMPAPTPMPLPQQTFAPAPTAGFAPQYPVQNQLPAFGQVPAQPMNQGMPPMYLAVPMAQPAPMPLQQAAVQPQQPLYQN